ncbi:centrosomal protein of 192 kDa isoform X3 [Danio rerio]|uniref:Centrosomal protein of 192 kDa isoform X3 n=2 Tax=Danio rerio TaxID=7955 RepID=A0AC58HIY7_DANRE
MENTQNIEEEPFPSFLSNASLGMPMAASTVAKIRPSIDNRVTDVQASYLEEAQSRMHSQGSDGSKEKIALSLKEDLDSIDEFIAANRFSDLLVNVNFDETESAAFTKTSSSGGAVPLLVSNSVPLRTTDKDTMAAEATVFQVILEEEDSEETDSEKCSDSFSSFLANEKLMSLDSMNSDMTDDDIDVTQLHDEELELYFNKLIPPAMQRGRVEGQEISVELPSSSSQHNTTESERNWQSLQVDFNKRNTHMADVRLAAAGMDSSPVSEQVDTDDELETYQDHGRERFGCTSRQQVWEGHLPHFRPGLEGGSSDDDLPAGGENTKTSTGIEGYCPAEEQIISLPFTGNGARSEEENGGISVASLLPTAIQSTGDVLRGLGIVGGSGENRDDDQIQSLLTRSGMVNSQNEMNNPAEVWLDTINLKKDVSHSLQDLSASDNPFLHSTNSSFHLSKILQESHTKTEENVNIIQTVDHSTPSLLGGPCGDSLVLNAHKRTSSENVLPGESLEPRDPYQRFNENHEEQNDIWNHQPEMSRLELQQDANATHSVVYQNEEGKWVTDLAYYSSFEKEMEANMPEDVALEFQSEDFLAGGKAMDKIIEDQEEFEKEHQFLQEEQIQNVNMSEVLGDTSWKIPSSSNILMRASQVSSELESGNQSYLRISLGEFFQRRSEALGCLGHSEEDYVKRPSFGYFITSPEKREPVALLRPSDIFSRGNSIHVETIQQSDADETLNQDDLDKTLEPNTAEPACANVQQKEEQVSQISTQHENNEDHTSEPPSSSSNLMLSISTIASAIADASLSSDPAQLGAMIVELSQQSRSKSHQQVKDLIRNPVAALQLNGLFEDLQKTTVVGDVSAPDMEKYLKKAEVSCSDSDESSSQSCFDVLTLADGLANSNNQVQQQLAPLKNTTMYKNEELSVMEEQEASKKCQVLAGKVFKNPRSDVKRSAIPRPKSSCLPTVTANPAKRSVGSDKRTSSYIPVKSKPFGLKPTNTGHCATSTNSKDVPESSIKTETALSATGSHSVKGDKSLSTSTLKSLPGLQNGGHSELTLLKTSPHKPRAQPNEPVIDQARLPKVSEATLSVSKEKSETINSNDELPGTQEQFGSPENSAPSSMEVTNCNFRPSTSPLTHSSPSQTSIQSGYGETFQGSPTSEMAQRNPAGDPGSPQSHCSSPSISRLTYLSINENTCVPTPDHRKKNTSMSLSTTIIRASPTPPMEPFSNDIVLRSMKSAEPLCHSEVAGLNVKTPMLDVRSESELDGNAYNNNRQSEPGSNIYAQGDSGYSSKLTNQHLPGAAIEQMHQALPQILGCGSCLSKSDDLTHGSVPGYNSQRVLTNFPNFLTEHSLFSSHLAKRYLSAEGPLHAPSCQIAGPSGLYRVSASGSNTSMVHMPSSLQSGYLSNIQQCPAQYVISKNYTHPNAESWTTGDLADIRTQVLVPSELKFHSSCCVGIASHTSLNIFNPSKHWQQVSISMTSISIDGEKVESLPFQWLIVKNKAIIGPKCSEEHKVLFIAPKAGLYQCTLSVSSWPASADAETIAQAEAFAKKVVLIAVAENPSIEVDVGKTGCLDFGDLVEGSTKALPLKLVNRTHATVPIRLVISANASAWHCFGLSKSPVAMSMDSSFNFGSAVTSITTSSVINHVLHASDSENPESFLLWVHFSAPQNCISSSGELGPANEYNARVDIEVDRPGTSHVIQSVALRARSGTPRVHAPKDLQMVSLQAALGQTAKQTLPLKNAGNIDVLLRLKGTDDNCCFSVRPKELTLKAGEEQYVEVSFTAQDTQKHRESLLTILVLPSGPQYEVMLKGELVHGVSRKVASTPAVLSQVDVPLILSNKQSITWGGVSLGRAVQQKLVLRNNSPTISQQLRLLIRGQDQDCFQLQSSFGPNERLTRNRELSIKPKEDVTVHLLFAPTRVASMLAKLEIKQSAACASQPGVKFTIPLSGYGGKSNVILENLRKHSDGYVATLRGVQSGHVSKLCICVRNTGSRAAFVKVVSYSSLKDQALMDSAVFSLSPSQFILKERTQEVIEIAMKASCREQALCQSGAALLATVCLFCGDEVSRQQFRKLLQIKPDAGNKVLSVKSLLKSIPFDEMFLGEEQVLEACDLPLRPNEAQTFYGNMRKVMLSLFGTTEILDLEESDHMEPTRPSQQHTSESDSLGSLSHYISNVSLDVLPVKGPSFTPSEPALKKTEPNMENTWSIKPEKMVLTVPTNNSVADPRHVQIMNHSNRVLSFELYWPAHCLTITPQHGFIEPQSHLQILVSTNPSLAHKSSMLPWNGQIYIQCGDQQKSIKVQIQQDLAMDVSTPIHATDCSLCPLPPQTDTPTVPGQSPQSSSIQPQVEIKNRTLIFPPTVSGESSECYLEVENNGGEMRWYLSSFAPPYVKDVDRSGGVYRATYTAFRCGKVSGILGTQESMKVQFTFLPRDQGDYAQFWDLECHPAAKPQHKSRVRFQLCGTGISTKQGSSVKQNCLPVEKEDRVKSRKRLESAGTKTESTAEMHRKGLYAPQSVYTFPATRVHSTSVLKVNFRNNSPSTHELKFISPEEPFYIKHSNYSLRSQHYINLPVQFVPDAAGQFSGTLHVQTDTDAKLAIELIGEALP